MFKNNLTIMPFEQNSFSQNTDYYVERKLIKIIFAYKATYEVF